MHLYSCNLVQNQAKQKIKIDTLIMQPLGLLVLSNLPGQNRLKNLKYFLGQGDNVLGSDSRCQIVLPSKYDMLNHALNIRLSHNFITIEALHSHLVYVQSNFLKKVRKDDNSDNYFPLAQNVQYLPKVGEFFYIGRIKAVICSSSRQQLFQMKNIINKDLFKLQVSQKSHTSPEISQVTQQIYIQKQQKVLDKESEKIEKQEIQRQQVLHLFQNVTLEQIKLDFTIKTQRIDNSQNASRTSNSKKIGQIQSGQANLKGCVNQSQKSKTERLEQDQNQVEPTLVVEDGMYGNEPTINLDEPLVDDYQQNNRHLLNLPQSDQGQKKQEVFSQQALMNEIRSQGKSQNRQIPDQEIDFSMPDTLVDKQPEQYHLLEKRKNQTIIKHDLNKNQEDQLDDMPATIQEDSPPKKMQQTKSVVQQLKAEQKQYKLYRKDPFSIEKEYGCSPERQKDIQTFDDLFGVAQQSQIKPAISHPDQANQGKKDENPFQPNSSSHIRLSRSNSRKSSRTKKMTIDSNKLKKKKKSLKNQQDQEQEEQIKVQNMVNLAGLKPTTAHIKYLNEQGFKIVTNPHHDYGLLLVKQPLKLCNKIILALLNGKRIENQQWIFNKESVIQTKINGLAWKQIYEKRGTHGQPLKGKGRFFISKRLNDLFDGVVEKLGGQVVTQLVDKRRVLNIVLKAEDNQDTELYLNNRQNKKWRFLKSEILLDCVLTGRYSLEEKHIIDLFKDQE